MLFLILSAMFIMLAYKRTSHAQSGTSTLEPSLQHLGIMMDGNRRWARERGITSYLGHRHGVEPLKMSIEFCLDHKIPYLTLYAFSLENFKRSAEELTYLFDVLAQEIAQKELNALFKQGVRVRFIGDRSYCPEPLKPILEKVERETATGNQLNLDILFCYGGQQEIVHAVKTLCARIREGVLSEHDISSQTFAECLWTSPTPPPDLIIRTGGDKRLSNFLTYQSAYSELYFLDCYWPDITREHLTKVLEEFNQRERRYGT